MANNLKRYIVGDVVLLTETATQSMKNSNRSSATPGYPSDNYINSIREHVGTIGIVTHTFYPGYEITVKFGESSFHAKGVWFEAQTA